MGSVKIRGLKRNKKFIHNTVRRTAEDTMKECMKELERVASETAPYDDGVLEMSGSHDVDSQGSKIVGSVGFEAWNDHPTRTYDFNYAIWIHEKTYNLGKKSKQKSGGHGGSGKSYPVGNKYLVRPLEGEAPYYRDMFEEDIKRALN